MKGRAPSARRRRDELLVPEVVRPHAENYGVYGRRKMHALLRRQGWETGRDHTERLMRLAGVRGAWKFTAEAPHRLWVCDVTYVATWPGSAYVAFITDVYSRRVVG